MPDSTQQAPVADADLPRDHAEVIALWPSIKDYAADIGIPYDHAKRQRHLKSIDDAYRPRVVEKAAERGFSYVTFELLTRIAKPRKQRSAGAPA